MSHGLARSFQVVPLSAVVDAPPPATPLATSALPREIHCFSCHFNATSPATIQAAVTRQSCPRCNGALFARRQKTPGPWTSLHHLARALFSFGALFVVANLALLFAIAPLVLAVPLASVLLTLIGVRMGFSAMATRSGAFSFPNLGRSFFEDGIGFGLVLFTLFELPLVVMGMTARSISEGLAAASATTLVLFLLGGIVGTIALATAEFLLVTDVLRTGEPESALSPADLYHRCRDLPVDATWVGMAFVGVRVASVIGISALLLDTMPTWVLATIAPVLLMVGQLASFALVGLFIRKHARHLDVPCDDADWKALTPASPLPTAAAPLLAARLGAADALIPPAEDPFHQERLVRAAKRGEGPIDLPDAATPLRLVRDEVFGQAPAAVSLGAPHPVSLSEILLPTPTPHAGLRPRDRWEQFAKTAV